MLEAMTIVANHYGRSGPVDSVADVVAGLTNADPSVAESILNGLAAGWPADKKPKLTPELEADLERVMQSLSTASKGLLVKLARNWGSDQFEAYAREVSKALLSQIDDEDVAVKQRQDAATELVKFRSLESEVVDELLDRVTPQLGPAVALGIVQSIAGSESPSAGERLVSRFPGLSPKLREAGIRVLLSRPEWTKSMLAAIEKGDILLAELSLDQKQAISNHPNQEVVKLARKLLSRGGALPNADRQAVLAKLMPVTERAGDPAAGKLVFTKNCANCHMHSGEGQKVGPDLTGMAVHPKAELLTHIVDPSRDVEGNYRVYTLLTADGVVVNGLLASESKTSLEMFDSQGKKLVVLREDVESLTASAKSLMPEGFENQINPDQMSDLLAFLTARGKFVPINLSKFATIPSDRGMFNNAEAQVERLIFPDWEPKTFKHVPFLLTDPQDGKIANVIMLHSARNDYVSKMPKSVKLPCNGPARAIHLLSGVSGWGFPADAKKSVSMIVRLQYSDGELEDHELLNGEHFADYIRRVDVPGSEFAFALRGQQLRYLAVYPKRADPIKDIEFVKGPDLTVPVVMAVTLETK